MRKILAIIWLLISPLGPVGVWGLDGEPDELCLADVGEGGELDEGVEGHLDVGEVLQGLVQEVGHDTSEDSLVGNQQDIALSLKLHHHRFKSCNQILEITIWKLISVQFHFGSFTFT